jgi:hypothetical protein
MEKLQDAGSHLPPLTFLERLESDLYLLLASSSGIDDVGLENVVWRLESHISISTHHCSADRSLEM